MLIGMEHMAAVLNEIYHSPFATHFKELPDAHKVAIYLIGRYYRSETRVLTMRQLHFMGASFFPTPGHLRPVLSDLKDMGVIYLHYRRSPKTSKTNFHFLNYRQLKEEHIRLTAEIEPDTIMNALQGEDLSKIKFPISLNHRND